MGALAPGRGLGEPHWRAKNLGLVYAHVMGLSLEKGKQEIKVAMISYPSIYRDQPPRAYAQAFSLSNSFRKPPDAFALFFTVTLLVTPALSLVLPLCTRSPAW